MADQIEVTQQHKELAKVSEALAHPTRIAILDYILSQEVCLCKDITKRLPIVQSSVSQHIKKLKDAGLIYGEKHGAKTWPKIWTKSYRKFVRQIDRKNTD